MTFASGTTREIDLRTARTNQGMLAALGIGFLLIAGCTVGAMEPETDEPGPDNPPPNADVNAGCSLGCHGDSKSPAPPSNLEGKTETNLRTVGAHRAHLNAASTMFRAVECQDCHVVPENVGDPGHMDDGDNLAELTFSALARTGGSQPEWNGDGCANTYCHGATLAGGTSVEPSWTLVDGSQSSCGSCHGAPPPAPHPADPNCGSCHPTMQPGSMTFLDPSSHINGVVDLAGGGDASCSSCHGSGDISAPPRDLAGNTDRASRGVGAHQVHLAASNLYRQVTCSNCHAVPVTVGDPLHIDGDNKAELTFDTLNPQATFDAATGTCNNLYCHGNGHSTLGTMSFVDQTPMQCGSCHEVGGNGGRTMSGEHREHIGEGIPCRSCHATVIGQGQTILDPTLHVNGVHEVVMPTGGTFNPAQRRCTNLACHGDERW